MRYRCRLVVGDRYESDAQRQGHEQQWALPLYAAAAETGHAPAAVTATELRCRLGQDADQSLEPPVASVGVVRAS